MSNVFYINYFEKNLHQMIISNKSPKLYHNLKNLPWPLSCLVVKTCLLMETVLLESSIWLCALGNSVFVNDQPQQKLG